jgi:hypothetical protein
MNDQTLLPSPADELIDALDELSLTISRALGGRCTMCNAVTAGVEPAIDVDELGRALTQVRRSLRAYRQGSDESQDEAPRNR